MKNALVAASAVCFLLSGAVAAQDNGQSIIIKGSPVTLERWTQSVSQNLERNLRYPVTAGQRDYPSGVVSVSFQCGEDGRPTAIALLRDSGSRSLDREALRAVSRISVMHPLPAGISHRQHFQANVAFATDPETMQRQLAALQREQSRHLARSAKAEPAIALNVGLRTPG